MTTENGTLDGIFSGLSAPTPDLTRMWLAVTRTAVGWDVAEAAHEADVDRADVERLEATGLALDEADDETLCALASVYQAALYKRPQSSGIAYQLSHLGDALRGDGNFPLARFLRNRRAALGLSIEQVVKRAGGVVSVEDLSHGEWDGTRTLTDYDDEFRALAEALEVPYLTLRLLAERGTITEADIDEWVAWRDAQKKSKQPPRRRKGGR